MPSWRFTLMPSAVSRYSWLAQLYAWGAYKKELPSYRAQRQNLISFSGLLCLVQVYLMVLCGTVGAWWQALIPLAFILLTVFNLWLISRLRRPMLTIKVQVFISLISPILLQVSLGGFGNSGFVMLWSILGLLGSTLFQGKKQVQIWFLVFVALVVAAMVTDDTWAEVAPAFFSHDLSRGLFLWNLFAVVGIIFLLTGYVMRKHAMVNQQLNSALDELSETVTVLSLTQDQIQTQSGEIKAKSDRIESQNQELNDSLQYARRLQAAVLDKHQANLPGAAGWFLFNRPLGTVSGDFFWAAQVRDEAVWVVADCTGHGVPGALLTMLGSSLLDAIVNELNVADPQTILMMLHHRLTRLLSGTTDPSAGMKDGMDISVINVDRASQMLTFCGGNHSLYHVRNGELEVLKGTRRSIGEENASLLWQNMVRPIESGDMIYMSSDGFRDQFGGPENKKMNATRFKDLLVQLAQMPMPEQKPYADNFFETWKGNVNQTDDVLLVGMEL